MQDIDQKIADHIIHGSHIVNYPRWLEEEVNDLALKIAHLDEIPFQAIVPLVRLASYGEANVRSLAIICSMEESTIENHIEALYHFKFIEKTDEGYIATPLGEKASKAIGNKMIIRESFDLKRRLAGIEGVINRLPTTD